MNQLLDTHQAVKELIREGLAEGQAEAIVSFQVRFLNENVATKQDVLLIQRDIENIRKDIEAQKLSTQKDMQLLSSQLTVRMGAMLVAVVGVLASLQTFAG